MANVATKLFREPAEAKQAVEELKAKGFKAEEIFVVAGAERAKSLSELNPASDAEKLSAAGLPEATVNYYRYSLDAGGIVVGVQADEARVGQAQEALRAIPVCSCGDRVCGVSPGFLKASRMSATNPLDAEMSGDFRRY
jgi:hypothetical protein